MIKLYLILLFLMGCSNSEFPWKDVSFEDAKIMANNSNKIIMLDFYSPW